MTKEIAILIILMISMMARSENIKSTDAEKIAFLFKNEYNQNDYCLTEPVQCVSETSSTDDEIMHTYNQPAEISNEKLKQINTLLESWKIKAESTFKPAKKKILVLGNSGVGISTFVQFIAGNNSKLISEESGIGNEEFIIKDDDKIGVSLKESFTIYPEEVALNENTTICDIPGFSNSRNLTEEILVSYNKEKYFKNMNEDSDNKIVILTEYYSVQNGIFKRSFINLLENIYNHYYNLIRPIYYNTKLHYKNVVLIAIKVPNIYKPRNSSKQIISDKIVIINIANYIERIKIFLTENLKQQINCNERNFFKFAITLIDSLLDEDMDGNYKKINIFRQPEEPGNLNEMKLFQDNKISLMETMLTDKTYSNDYFGREYDSIEPNKLKSLSERFEKFKTCIKQSVNMNLEETLNKLTFVLPLYNVLQEDPIYNPFDTTYKHIEILNNEINALYKLKYHFN